MSPARFVNDFAGILTFDETDALEIKLMTCHDEDSVQIVVIILRDFGRQDPDAYGAALIERWGIGYNSNEKGLLILVKPKNQFGPLKVSVTPNSYLKGSFDESVSLSIASNDMAPLLEKERLFQALNTGIDAVKAHLEGNYVVKAPGKVKALYLIILSVLILAVGSVVTVVLMKKNRK